MIPGGGWHPDDHSSSSAYRTAQVRAMAEEVLDFIHSKKPAHDAHSHEMTPWVVAASGAKNALEYLRRLAEHQEG